MVLGRVVRCAPQGPGVPLQVVVAGAAAALDGQHTWRR